MRSSVLAAAFAAGALAVPFHQHQQREVVTDYNVVYRTQVVTVTAGASETTAATRSRKPHYGHRWRPWHWTRPATSAEPTTESSAVAATTESSATAPIVSVTLTSSSSIVAPTTSEAPASSSVAPSSADVAPTTSEALSSTSVAPTTSEAPSSTSIVPTTSEAPVSTSVAPTTVEASSSTSIAPTTSEAPTSTSVAPTTSEAPSSTSVAPTTSEAPTSTSVAPTTSEAPTSTSVAPTTSEAPTSTSVAPTTSEVPSSTSVAPTTSEVPSSTSVAPTTSEAPSSTSVAPSSTAISSTSSADNSVATTYQGKVLKHHNVHRQNHTSPDLEWDDGLASTAQKIAESCVYAHNTDEDGGGYGQNIAAGVTADDITTVITDLFYNGEVGFFDGLYGQPQPDMTNFEKWGHFTQVVWKSTTHVGCYTHQCGTLQNVGTSVPPYFTVCNYRDPGNYANEYADNVLEPLNLPSVDASYQVA